MIDLLVLMLLLCLSVVNIVLVETLGKGGSTNGPFLVIGESISGVSLIFVMAVLFYHFKRVYWPS